MESVIIISDEDEEEGKDETEFRGSASNTEEGESEETTVLIDDTDSANESAEETNTENRLVSSLNLRPKVCPVNLYNSNVWPFEVVLRTLC